MAGAEDAGVSVMQEPGLVPGSLCPNRAGTRWGWSLVQLSFGTWWGVGKSRERVRFAKLPLLKWASIHLIHHNEWA